MAKKKVSKKVAKKISKKVSAKKVTKKISAKKVAEKTGKKKVVKKSSSSSDKRAGGITPSSKYATFPSSSLPRSNYSSSENVRDKYGIARSGEMNFTGGRLTVLVALGAIVIVIATWGIFSGDGGSDTSDLPSPLTETGSPSESFGDKEETNREGSSVEDNENGAAPNPEAQKEQIQEQQQNSETGEAVQGDGSPETYRPTPDVPTQEGSDQSGTYTVRSGDTLQGIAKKTLGDPLKYKEIVKINGISPSSGIRIGQVLIIPPKQ